MTEFSQIKTHRTNDHHSVGIRTLNLWLPELPEQQTFKMIMLNTSNSEAPLETENIRLQSVKMAANLYRLTRLKLHKKMSLPSNSLWFFSNLYQINALSLILSFFLKLELIRETFC